VALTFKSGWLTNITIKAKQATPKKARLWRVIFRRPSLEPFPKDQFFGGAVTTFLSCQAVATLVAKPAQRVG
jgi:hypothetical protein